MCFSTLILSSLHWLPADFRSHFYIYINIYFNSRLAPAGGLPLKLGVTELFSTKTESIESAEQSHLQTFLFLYSVLFEIIFSVFFLVFLFFFIILLTVFPMSLLSLFLSFSFVMHSALWLHVCEKHFIFTSWWSVQNHMSVIFTFSAALILLNLCVGACCASPDPTVTEKCQDTSLWELSAMLFEGFWERFFTCMRLLLK